MLVQISAFRWTTIRAAYLLSAAVLALGVIVLSVGTVALTPAGDTSAPAQLGAAVSQPTLGEPSALAPLPRVATSAPSPGARNAAAHAYGKLPLAFVPNAGQTDHSVRYYAQGAAYSFYFTDHKAVLALKKGDRGHALQLRFLGANPNAELKAADRGAGRVNYLTGSQHHANLPTYERIIYRDLWPGIDMVFRGAGGKLIYEFRLSPGANPSDIRLAYAGAKDVSLSAGGALSIDTPLGTLKDAAPQSFQRIDGHRVPVDSRYALAGDSYGFSVGGHDVRQPLVIDPSLAYSTYLGGSDDDLTAGIAVDAAGFAYVTGGTGSTDFPTTAGAFDTTYNGNDAFVTKLDPTGSSLIYSTYLGGSGLSGPRDDSGAGIAVDAAGAAYVTGLTESLDFPTTAGAFDTSLGGGFGRDAFVTKLDPTGSSLAYSTYLGGSSSERAGRIAVDAAGFAYVTGYTDTDFPTTAGAFDTSLGSGDAYVTKLDPTGSSLAYSTYLGGSGDERGFDIAVDAAGAAYATGQTDSTNFPITAGAFDTSHNGGFDDAFVSKLDPTGSSLAYSTYLGGSGFEHGAGIAVDAAGAAYVTGRTASTDFPTPAGAFDTSHNGGFRDAFISKLNPTGSSLAYSTYLGGSGAEDGFDIAVDVAGSAYVTGRTESTDFPTTADAFDASLGGVTFSGGVDAYVTKLDLSGSSLAYSTYLGGSSLEEGDAIAVDAAGAAYVTGRNTGNFPTTPGAFDATLNDGVPSPDNDAFVAKLTDTPPPQGKVSARGRVATVQGTPIGFSAVNDCNPSLSTLPSVVGTLAGGRIWTKTTVTSSTCTDQLPPSPLGFDAQTGTASGTFGPSAPGGRNGQQGTLQWTYYDSSPDRVQFTLRGSSGTVVYQANQQTPSAYRGSPGGVWTSGP